MINRELDPKAQALRIEVNRKGVMGRRHSENNAPKRSKSPFRVGKTGWKMREAYPILAENVAIAQHMSR